MVNTEVIKKCQQGDRESMCEIYRQYRKNALGTAYLIAESRGIAEDIVQEAFVEAFSRIEQLKNAETFDVWFYKILVRTGWRMVKRHNYYIPVSDESITDLDVDMNSSIGIDNSDTRMAISEAMEKLSLPLKTVIILYYYNDMSIKEISTVLNCLQGTVKSRLHNARRQLFCELYGTFDESELNKNSCNFFNRKEFGINAKHV